MTQIMLNMQYHWLNLNLLNLNLLQNKNLVIKKDQKTNLHLLHITVSGTRCRVVFQSYFTAIYHSSLLVFSFLPCLCTFTGPSLHVINCYRKILTLASFCCFFAAWPQTCCSVPAHAYSLSLSRSCGFNISLQVFIVSTVIGKTLQCKCRQMLWTIAARKSWWRNLLSYNHSSLEKSHCLICSTVIRYVSFVVMSSCSSNSDVCMGLQYTRTMVYERTAVMHVLGCTCSSPVRSLMQI